MKFDHSRIEKNATLMLVLSLLVVSIGGIVEIAPLFYMQNTIEKVEGVRPYSPLELAGRNIYVREGCYNCHSQMVRPMRDEVERYGHYSLAAESMYDHPFQWGSKRTGPDLARVGQRYSNEWHVQHLVDPRSVVPESIMPGYRFLLSTELRTDDIIAHLKANASVGVPYDAEMIEVAEADMRDQADPDADWDGLLARYPKAQTGDFDGTPGAVAREAGVLAYIPGPVPVVGLSCYRAGKNFWGACWITKHCRIWPIPGGWSFWSSPSSGGWRWCSVPGPARTTRNAPRCLSRMIGSLANEQA